MRLDSSPQSTYRDDELVDLKGTCIFWGGDRTALNPATIYRQIAKGLHPKPIKVGSLSRWSLNELRAERQRRMDAR